jgi:hypothetical protein
VIDALRRLLRSGQGFTRPDPSLQLRHLTFSWVLTDQLAIGPMPRSEMHWRQLEAAGFKSRFSCCYPGEEAGLILPAGWQSDGVALPDHREQEPMQEARLALALSRAEALMLQAPPMYLHCLAGRERSPLLAVGLTTRRRQVDTLAALDWVRRCHPMAMPIVSHLVLLEAMVSA